MIEVNIPKDLDNYEAKFVGPFTVRQTICAVCALPAAIGIFNLTKESLGIDIAGFLCIIPAGIAYLFGWLKPYGMKFEVFIRSIFITTVLAPSKRKYKTVNFFKTLVSDPPSKKKKGKGSSDDNYEPSTKAIF